MRIAAAVLLVGVFVASRIALLVTSYDANQNWEEPVFLFSASELARVGVAGVFDYQDDLNHGGSVPLLLLAVPWLRVTGTSLVALKGLAILWSACTLVAFLAVGWRYFSPRTALAWGTCFVALSPALARLNVTLVGSHPEALLPCALALAAYLEWVRRRPTASSESWPLAVALGLCCGVAVWVSYAALMFVLPVLILRAVFAKSARTLAGVAVGVVVGLGPWIYQNIWLRPHGALLWKSHVGSAAGGDGTVERLRYALADLAASFGVDWGGGWLILFACGAALVAWTVALVNSRRNALAVWQPLAIAPFVAASYLGLVLIGAARLPASAAEGYYHYRFYVPLLAALFWMVALAIDPLISIVGRIPVALAAVVVLAAAVRAQAALYGQGNHYQADFARDRLRGCHVFGIAESDRSPDWATAIHRLETLPDAGCRDRAFTGLGWGIAERFVQSRDAEQARYALQAIPDPRLRSDACQGFAFLVGHTSSESFGAAQQSDAIQQMAAACR